MTSSSSSFVASYSWKYDVFLSFRGADTRRSFTSHLFAALCRKGLQTFIDDDDIKRGEEIDESLLQAIQNSKVAVIIFSKEYASSTWCLNELAKIIECHQTRRQIVIPVFYEVDPSHLRKQEGDVATAFTRHEQNTKNAHNIQKWKDALTTATSLSGWESKLSRTDHLLIEHIVEDILKRLNQSTVCDDFEPLIGISSHIDQLKEVLAIESLDICIIGIWGMGGIGKTTIAEVIFSKMLHQFEGCCFLDNVREQSKTRGVKELQKELISKAMGEKDQLSTRFLKARIQYKKLLIVLDDVNDPLQLEYLIGDPCLFGSGTKIIITSRDKNVFEARANFIYRVEPLNHDESLQLFSRTTIKQNHPSQDYVSFSKSIVKYAQGNPLALKVLGSFLAGKDVEQWEGALNKLSKIPNQNIQVVLQISYDGLDRVEKDIFLHIACFFKGDNIDTVRQVFRRCEIDADIIISVLIDKCLVTLCGKTLGMHDLLQEMGKEIVRLESKFPSHYSRLWDPTDIYNVFVENKGAEAVESIILDMSKIREIDLNPKVFTKMPNLKFLKFYIPNRHGCFQEKSKLHLFQGLDYLPNKLRYFRWDEYPLESFPPNFRPENLVILKLPNSKIIQLCGEAKVLGLLEVLEVLNMEGCLNFDTFPEISSNIKKLYLAKTAIKEVPSSSIELLSALKLLEMSYCSELESLPSNFFNKLTSLSTLYLRGCRRLKKLPEISENMYSLEELYLSETGIEEIPSSIGNLKGLKHLNMHNCRKLALLPKSFSDLASLGRLFLGIDLVPKGNKCELREARHPHLVDHHSLPLLLEGISCLRNLSLYNCNLVELPEDLSFISSLQILDLRGNNFKRISATIKQLSQLEVLNIRNCSRLLSLPELPLSVSRLYADDCRSLEKIWTLKQLISDSQGLVHKFYLFNNCFKLDEGECQAIAKALLTYQTTFTRNQIPKSAFRGNKVCNSFFFLFLFLFCIIINNFVVFCYDSGCFPYGLSRK
ncbi:hypothetical protein K2173_018599 [Erythroxylum novogranatense]|uniref:TIR domain-containing protein n=1 Tax=Erythroxylum novogranatense TaxID=1862640 RepID=A0AAV8UAW1_9ROSI|nr:hypothetical protein K2173_018599 [Erythroxylum novogranatense]